MKYIKSLWGVLILLLALTLVMTGCGASGGGAPTETVEASQEEPAGGGEPQVEPSSQPTAIPPTLTPTPTQVPVQAVDPCQGLSGYLDMQVLVGPAEAAGLEPVAVGQMPFSVVSDQSPYVVEGGGQISYAETLNKEWGSYQVTMDMDSNLSGECQAGAEGGVLHTMIDLSGEQLVKVDAGEFQAEYPWSGSHNFELDFPLEEGATAQGEGWSFVLHLN